MLIQIREIKFKPFIVKINESMQHKKAIKLFKQKVINYLTEKGTEVITSVSNEPIDRR